MYSSEGQLFTNQGPDALATLREALRWPFGECLFFLRIHLRSSVCLCIPLHSSVFLCSTEYSSITLFLYSCVLLYIPVFLYSFTYPHIPSYSCVLLCSPLHSCVSLCIPPYDSVSLCILGVPRCTQNASQERSKSRVSLDSAPTTVFPRSKKKPLRAVYAKSTILE